MDALYIKVNRGTESRVTGRKIKGQCPHLGPVLFVQFSEIYTRCESQFKDGNEDDIQIKQDINKHTFLTK